HEAEDRHQHYGDLLAMVQAKGLEFIDRCVGHRGISVFLIRAGRLPAASWSGVEYDVRTLSASGSRLCPWVRRPWRRRPSVWVPRPWPWPRRPWELRPWPALPWP